MSAFCLLGNGNSLVKNVLGFPSTFQTPEGESPEPFEPLLGQIQTLEMEIAPSPEELGPPDSEIVSSYKGYKVYRLTANTTKAYDALRKLHEEGDMDFWQTPSFRGDTDILVNSNQEKELQDFMGFYKINNSVIIDDIDRY